MEEYEKVPYPVGRGYKCPLEKISHPTERRNLCNFTVLTYKCMLVIIFNKVYKYVLHYKPVFWKKLEITCINLQKIRFECDLILKLPTNHQGESMFKDKLMFWIKKACIVF